MKGKLLPGYLDAVAQAVAEPPPDFSKVVQQSAPPPEEPPPDVSTVAPMELSHARSWSANPAAPGPGSARSVTRPEGDSLRGAWPPDRDSTMTDGVTTAPTVAVRALNSALATDDRIELAMVPVGDGLTIVWKCMF